MNKYKAKRVYYHPQTGQVLPSPHSQDAIPFDSILECSTYLALVNLVGAGNIIRQCSLLIKPPTDRYTAIFWKCDFRVYKGNDNPFDYINLESKGFVTREFIRNLRYLEYFSPVDYDRLMLVANQPIELLDNNVDVWMLPQAIKYLSEQGYGLNKVTVAN